MKHDIGPMQHRRLSLHLRCERIHTTSNRQARCRGQANHLLTAANILFMSRLIVKLLEWKTHAAKHRFLELSGYSLGIWGSPPFDRTAAVVMFAFQQAPSTPSNVVHSTSYISHTSQNICSCTQLGCSFHSSCSIVHMACE